MTLFNFLKISSFLYNSLVGRIDTNLGEWVNNDLHGVFRIVD